MTILRIHRGDAKHSEITPRRAPLRLVCPLGVFAVKHY
jgi:hypothetical protein